MPGRATPPERPRRRMSGGASRRPCGEYTTGSWPVSQRLLRGPTGKLSGPGEQLLEQRDRAGVVGVAQPEEGLLADRRTVMRAGEPDQRGDPFVVRALGEGEDGALLHRQVHVVRVHEVAQAAGRRLPRRLPQPEYRRTARFLRDSRVAGEAEQVGPHGDAVGEDRGKDRLPPDLAAGTRRHIEQEARGGRSRDGAEVRHRCAARGALLTAHEDPHPGDLAAAHGQRDPRGTLRASTVAVVVVVAPGGDAVPAAARVVALERDDVAAIAAHTRPRGVVEAYLAVRGAGHAVAQPLEREGEDERGDHWFMISSSTFAARGSCDCPIQNSAFLRSSRFGSRRAMSISLSSAAGAPPPPETETSRSLLSRVCRRWPNAPGPAQS